MINFLANILQNNVFGNLFGDVVSGPPAAPEPIEFDPVATIFLALFLIVVMAGLIVFLFFGIRKDRVKIEMLKSGESGDVAIEDFDEYIKQRCKNPKSGFVVFRIIFPDSSSIIESYGVKHYEFAIKAILKKLQKSFPDGTRFSVKEGQIQILVNGKQDEDQLKVFAAASLMECTSTIQVNDNLAITFDVSVAIVPYNENNKTGEQIESNLISMLAQSQRKGLNQYSIHTVGSTEPDSEEYKTYLEIKSAIENKEFVLYYQPINDLITDDTIGFESLLRWNHRTMGVLPPSTFLNILDTSGDINWVGTWAFEQLLSRHMAWSRIDPDKKFFISMNLSAKQLMNEKIVSEFRQVLKKFKVTPGDVCMEIAEYAFMQKGVISSNIDSLAQAGFLIAVDNYSMEMSVTALDKHKIDFIKIEREFVNRAFGNDEMTKDLLNLILSYSNKRGIKVVAEGVENEEVLMVLKDRNVRYGQGYHFGKPKAAEEIKFVG